MIALSFQARRLLRDLLDDVKARPRYRGGFVVDEEGYSHPWGAVDCERYGECVATKEDVRRLGAALRRVGCDLTFDECDGLVSEALWRDSDGDPWYIVTMSHPRKQYLDHATYIREKRMRRIQKLKGLGLCIVCGKERPNEGRVSCHDCAVKANARKKRAKAA